MQDVMEGTSVAICPDGVPHYPKFASESTAQRLGRALNTDLAG